MILKKKNIFILPSLPGFHINEAISNDKCQEDCYNNFNGNKIKILPSKNQILKSKINRKSLNIIVIQNSVCVNVFELFFMF